MKDKRAMALRCLHCDTETTFRCRDVPSPVLPHGTEWSHNEIRCEGCGGLWCVEWRDNEVLISSPSARFRPSVFGLVDKVPEKHNGRDDLFAAKEPAQEAERDD